MINRDSNSGNTNTCTCNQSAVPCDWPGSIFIVVCTPVWEFPTDSDHAILIRSISFLRPTHVAER